MRSASSGLGSAPNHFAEIRATVPDLELGRDVDATAAMELVRSGGASLTAVLARAGADLGVLGEASGEEVEIVVVEPGRIAVEHFLDLVARAHVAVASSGSFQTAGPSKPEGR